MSKVQLHGILLEFGICFLEFAFVCNLNYVLMSKKYKTYHISCGKCQTYLLTYHKYGGGKGIVRLYFHRIMAPEALVRQLEKDFGDVLNLACKSCGEILGTPDIQKGKGVFRMRRGLFHRKLISS